MGARDNTWHLKFSASEMERFRKALYSLSCSCRTIANEVQSEVIQELVDDLFQKMASGSAACFQLVFNLACFAH